MNAWQLIKARLDAGEKIKYVVSLRKEQPKKRRKNPRKLRFLERKVKAKPVVFGSRSNGSYTKRDNEEPKYRRKMRQAAQKISRRKQGMR